MKKLLAWYSSLDVKTSGDKRFLCENRTFVFFMFLNKGAQTKKNGRSGKRLPMKIKVFAFECAH